MTYPIGKEEWEKMYKDLIPDRTIAQIYTYFKIVQNNYKVCTEYKRKSDALLNGADNIKIFWEDSEECKYSAIKIIVFSALFLEAVINDYGLSNISKNFIENYIEKANVKSKWVIIPKLITGNDFPTDSKAFKLLGELISLRNDHVHYKSKKIPNDYEGYVEFITENQKEFYHDVEIACNCINECLQELKKIDNTDWELFKFIEKIE